jgi:hypothetical protein
LQVLANLVEDLVSPAWIRLDPVVGEHLRVTGE